MTERSFSRVVTKLEEAQFFLKRLSETWNDREAAHYFSAFVSAARSVTFTLQAVMDSTGDFASWYDERRTTLRDCPISRFLLEARNESQKVGIAPVSYSGVASRLDDDGTPHCSRTYRFVSLENPKVDVPKGEALSQSRHHLEQIASLVADCYEKFRSTVDPDDSLAESVNDASTVAPFDPAVCPLHASSSRR